MSTEPIEERVVTNVRIYAHSEGALIWYTDVPVGHNYVAFDPQFGPRGVHRELEFTAAPIIQPTITKFADCNRRHCEEYDG